MKKYIIALGGLGAIVTPLVSVISCNKTPKKDNIGSTNKDKLLTKKIEDYLKVNQASLIIKLNKARENSNNIAELKTNLITNIISDLVLGFGNDSDKLSTYATTEKKKSIFVNKLSFTNETPKNHFKMKGTYGVLLGTETVLANKELGYIQANKDFYEKYDKTLDKPMFKLAVDSFKKIGNNETFGSILEKVKSVIGDKYDKIKDKKLNITGKNIKAMISAFEMIIHNIDADLSIVLKSNDKLSGILKLARTPNIIINKKEFNKGVMSLIKTFATLVLNNKDNVGDVIDIINLFKPGLINKDKTKLIKGLFMDKRVVAILTTLSTLTPEKYNNISSEVNNLLKTKELTLASLLSTDNIKSINIIFNNLGISYSDLINLFIDNFDNIKPLIPFLNQRGILKGKSVEIFSSLNKENIQNFIKGIKKITGVEEKDNIDKVLDKISKLSLGNLLNSIKGSKILKSFFFNTKLGKMSMTFRFSIILYLTKKVVNLGGQIIYEGFDVDNSSATISKKAKYFDEVPMFSYKFFKIIKSALNVKLEGMGKIGDKLPKSIYAKLDNMFKYINSLNTPTKQEEFTKELQNGVKNILSLLLKKHSEVESTNLLNKILANKIFLKLINLFN